ISQTPRLTGLSQELRDQIFRSLFQDTTLTFVLTDTSKIVRREINTEANNLTLLRTCKQIRQDVKDIWIRNSLFTFEAVGALLKAMTSWPVYIVSKIQDVKLVLNHSMRLKYKGFDQSRDPVGIVELLGILSNLKLERLIIQNAAHLSVTYLRIQDLVKYGHGWRELRYVRTTSDLLDFDHRDHVIWRIGLCLCDGDDFQREPQPAAWTKYLLERDGQESGSVVKVYRTREE
ncbi:hypothetical protein M501DRAFT_923516, partial [Patellaria atrata CBS 101060]